MEATLPRPLNFPPGEQYGYSNTNYHLLAMIIRRITGQAYGDFLRERIFEPLQMNDTRVIDLDEIIPHRAAGYLLSDKGFQNGKYVAPSVLGYGGGGLRSTVLDMAKWDAALGSGTVLKQERLQQMWTPAQLNNGQASSYGFGWSVRSVRGHRCVAHNGSHVTGFSTTIQRFVDDRLSVIVLTNCKPADVTRIAEQVAGCYEPDLCEVAGEGFAK